MKLIDRQGQVLSTGNAQDKCLGFLYGTASGRALVSILIKPGVSKACGRLLDTGLSAYFVPHFCRANGIDMSEYQEKAFCSFNDFFTRKIKSVLRPIDEDENVLISPCDSRLTFYRLNRETRFCVKNTKYDLHKLLKNEKLAEEYEGGYIGIFRLCVDDYHRYHYIDDGIKGKEHRINGVFHTVNPAANEKYPIYKENTREYCIHRTKNFGDVIVMEVGALLVGRIVNEKGVQKAVRGMEKGYFEYGGSTVILIFKKETIIPDKDILENTRKGCETRVKLGEKIGVKKLK